MSADTMTLQLAQRGVLTLPKSLRETYTLSPGDELTLLYLLGVFVLSRRRSVIDTLADKITAELVEKGETLESMLQTLRAERERYTLTSGPTHG